MKRSKTPVSGFEDSQDSPVIAPESVLEGFDGVDKDIQRPKGRKSLKSSLAKFQDDTSTPLRELKPNPRNPRKMTDQRREMLVNALKKFGDLGGIVFNRRSGQLVGGHQRVEAFRADPEARVTVLERLPKPTEVGTVALGFVESGGERYAYREVDWDPKIETAANIAANQHSGDWVTSDLEGLLNELSPDERLLAGFDLESIEGLDLGIGNTETDSSSVEEGSGIELFSYDQRVAQYIEDHQKDTLADQIKAVMTPALAMAEFNNLASGKQGGYWISSLFNPHRLSVDTAKSKSFAASLSKVSFQKMRAKWMSKWYDCKPIWLKYGQLGWGGVQVAAEFNPNIAHSIVTTYSNSGDVLDPCHGWGGRVVGFLAANTGASYLGFDPCKKTNEGVKQLIDFLLKSTCKSTAKVVCCPFEKADLKGRKFTLALTSPPYFDIERYSDEDTQSIAKFKTFEDWVQGWFEPMILKVVNALVDKGVFVLNVGDVKYPLSRIVFDFCRRNKFSCVRLHDYLIGGSGIGDRSSVESRGESFLKISRH